MLDNKKKSRFKKFYKKIEIVNIGIFPVLLICFIIFALVEEFYNGFFSFYFSQFFIIIPLIISATIFAKSDIDLDKIFSFDLGIKSRIFLFFLFQIIFSLSIFYRINEDMDLEPKEKKEMENKQEFLEIMNIKLENSKDRKIETIAKLGQKTEDILFDFGINKNSAKLINENIKKQNKEMEIQLYKDEKIFIKRDENEKHKIVFDKIGSLPKEFYLLPDDFYPESINKYYYLFFFSFVVFGMFQFALLFEKNDYKKIKIFSKKLLTIFVIFLCVLFLSFAIYVFLKYNFNFDIFTWVLENM